MRYVQVARNARVYRVGFRDHEPTVETIELHSRFILSKFERGGRQHYAMAPSDKPGFRLVWTHGSRRAIGRVYGAVLRLATAALARGVGLELVPSRADIATKHCRNPKRALRALIGERLPFAVEIELRQMAEQGLSF